MAYKLPHMNTITIFVLLRFSFKQHNRVRDWSLMTTSIDIICHSTETKKKNLHWWINVVRGSLPVASNNIPLSAFVFTKFSSLCHCSPIKSDIQKYLPFSAAVYVMEIVLIRKSKALALMGAHSFLHINCTLWRSFSYFVIPLEIKRKLDMRWDWH